MSPKSNRGFASMNKEKQRAIASKGGKAAHAKGTAHEFTPEEARAAGRKGGMAAHQRGTAHEFTPEEARAAGRKGGHHSRAARATAVPPPIPAQPEGAQNQNLREPGGPMEQSPPPSPLQVIQQGPVGHPVPSGIIP